MKKYVVLAAAFLLAGCSGTELPKLENPFAGPSIAESYEANLTDILIPAPMETVSDKSLATLNAAGKRIGVESYAGRVDYPLLIDAMTANMKRQGWTLLASSSGLKSVQLWEKGSYRAAVTYTNAPALARKGMDVWVIDTLNNMQVSQ